MFQTNIVENKNTHFMLNKLFSENRAVYEIMCKKYGRPTARQATGDNIMWRRKYAICMPDN
jgi:hypothetical protein